MFALLMTLVLAAGPVKKAEPDPQVPLLLAQQRIAAKDFSGAEKILRDVSAKSPKTAGVHLLLGEVAERRADDRAAFWEYQWELLRAGGESPTGEEAAKRSAAIAQGETPAAEQVMKVLQAMGEAGTMAERSLATVRAARKQGDAFVLRVFEAELVEMTGDAAGAEKLFRELIAADPAFVPARLGLARALERAGKTGDAQKQLDEAKKIDPNHWSLRNAAAR